MKYGTYCQRCGDVKVVAHRDAHMDFCQLCIGGIKTGQPPTIEQSRDAKNRYTEKVWWSTHR